MLIAIASVGAGISPTAPAGPQWARMAGTVFVLSPVAGIGIGIAAIGALDWSGAESA